jgi:hypothetical protein
MDMPSIAPVPTVRSNHPPDDASDDGEHADGREERIGDEWWRMVSSAHNCQPLEPSQDPCV